ncbi:MAG: hypothetical protein U0527_00335 [Candidatus Eisenbacteria bacterium]
MRSVLIAATLVLSSALVSKSSAQPGPYYQELTLVEYSGIATDSRIQSRGCGWCEVAWRAPDGTIASRGVHSRQLQPLVAHGPGRDPVMTLGIGGVYLAWASGDEIKVTSSTGNWLPETTLSTGFDLETHHPDFCASTDALAPDLAWLEGPRVIFAAALPNGGWGAPEVAATDAQPYDWYGLQIERTINQRPRVYYFNANYALVYRERTAPGVWTPALSLPQEHGDFAWPFRVVGGIGYYGLHSILHVGLYRTCPCNDLYFARETSDHVWASPVTLTVDRDAYNWPTELGLAMSPDGSAHCFWQQRFFDQGMAPTGEDVFYRVRDSQGSWQDMPAVTDSPGRYTDVSVGDCVGGSNAPEFCWIQSAPPGSRVMVLVDTFTGSEVPDTPPALDLAITPNPSVSGFSISWTNPSRAMARLEILGVDGRRVRTLRSSESFVWDGRDDGGKEMPTGAYWFRLSTATRREIGRGVKLR